MVVLFFTTLARNGMSMVAWAVWWVFLLYTFVQAHEAEPNNKYGGGKYRPDCVVLLITQVGTRAAAAPAADTHHL